MDNLPNDSSDGNKLPPAFGTHFDPHSNPQDPNNPYQTQPPVSPQITSESAENLTHSEVAKHQHRDAHGHFITEHPKEESNISPVSVPPTTPTTPIPSVPPIQVIHGSDGGNDESDDNLAEFKLKNPFSKFFHWLMRLIKSEGINIKIKPLTAIAITVALTGGGGIAGGALVYFFPHNSPLLHRAVVYQGKLQRTETGFVLTLPNSDLYTLKPKTNTNINFKSLSNGPVLVKGNLTPENFVIEVSEIIPLGTSSDSQTSPNIPNQDLLQR